jgi:hypothetical protein
MSVAERQPAQQFGVSQGQDYGRSYADAGPQAGGELWSPERYRAASLAR